MKFWEKKLFRDRKEAGIKLAQKLSKFGHENPVILAIPRGGVSIGFEVARILKAPLDVIVARKIGAPTQPELGVGAIAEGGIVILDKDLIKHLQIKDAVINTIIDKEKHEIERRKSLYRGKRNIVNLEGRNVIVVDDGLATGVTAKAAVEAIRKLGAKKIIFAAPVCAYDSVKDLESLLDNLICLATPYEFSSVGIWYRNFDQVTDEEVKMLLESSKSFSPYSFKASP